MWLDYSKATQYYLLLMHLLLFSFATQIRLFFISSIFSLVTTCHIQIQHLTFSGSPKIAVFLNTPTFSHLTKKKKKISSRLSVPLSVCLLLCAERSSSCLPSDFLQHNPGNLGHTQKDRISACNWKDKAMHWAVPGSTWPASHPPAILTTIPQMDNIFNG